MAADPMRGETNSDTSVRQQGCSAQHLLAALQEVVDQHPTARLVRNQVDNLSVIDEDEVGMLDLTFGRFVSWNDDSQR
jgi:ATP-dependent exoDNAse (exonuclease V) alpha subunit